MASQKLLTNQTFSAGFYNQKCCFTVQNLPLPDKKVKVPLSFNIAEKMLFRGLPINTSTYLAKELEKRFLGKSHT